MAFTTPKELFKLIIILFGLTNSPMTFQMIMNKILQNFVNTKKVASFIDNVIMGMEEEGEHNEVVEECHKLHSACTSTTSELIFTN